MRRFIRCLDIPGLRGYFALAGAGLTVLAGVILYIVYSLALDGYFAAARIAYNR